MKGTGTLSETYFTPIRPQFWKWAGKQNGEIVCDWLGTPLLMFREELLLILKDLQPYGYPDLAPILLVCLATRDNWANSRKWLQRKMASIAIPESSIEELLASLDRVQELPADLKSSPQAKSSLIRVAFEQIAPEIDPEQSRECLDFLESLLPHLDGESIVPAPFHELDRERFIKQTRYLKTGLARVTPEAIRSLLRTGLEQQLLPAPVEIPEEPLTFRERLASWTTDSQLFGLARIATQLLSLLKWTQPLRHPDESAQGGVSDISNRGRLDRLLLSELALDDETLAVRVALNEALYLKRESSSASPPHRRAVLVDTSLRMWGVPRIYAASTALALAAGRDFDETLTVSVEVFDRDDSREVDLSRREGCLELLAGLSPILNPAELIAKWVSEFTATEQPLEPVFVTCRRTFEIPEVQSELGRIPGDYFVALVEGDGRFELRQHTPHGWKTIRELTIDLETLLEPLRNSVPLKVSPRSDDYVPAIMRVEPFPLRLPFQLSHRQFWTVSDHKVLSFASGGRLLYWDRRDQGPIQVGVDLTVGNVESWCTVPDNYASPGQSRPAPQLSHAVIATHTWTLLTVDLEQKTARDVPLITQLPAQGVMKPQALVVPECVFLIQRNKITAFSLENGEKLAELSTSQYGSLSFSGNRYLVNSEGFWFRLSCDGEIHLAPVVNSHGAFFIAAGTGPSEPLLLPMMYKRNTADMRRVPDFRQINGRKFWQRDSYVFGSEHDFPKKSQQANPSTLPNVQTIGMWDLASDDPWELKRMFGITEEVVLQSIALRHLHLRNSLRTKFTAISVGSDGVALRSNRQKWWRIVLEGNTLKLVLLDKPDPSSQIVNFQKYDAGSRRRAFLGGTLPNGNSVRLDPRGLLHLIPADARTPEISLVLDGNNVSGWIDEGSRFGDSYYVSGGSVSVPHAWHKLVAPFFGVDS